MYLMQTYNDYCSENGLDLYGSTRVKLPKPELYVIFTGDRKDHPDYITLKDEFCRRYSCFRIYPDGLALARGNEAVPGRDSTTIASARNTAAKRFVAFKTVFILLFSPFLI